MGQNVSEGAIVQHLAKLRTRRVDVGKAVPPPLRRGGGGASRPFNPVKSKPPAPAASRKTRGHRTKQESETEEESECETVRGDSDSGSEYGKKPQSKKTRRAWPRRSKAQAAPDDAAENNGESDTEHDGATDDERPYELLAAGAQFLDYPNCSQPDSVTSGEQSKVVVLKYRSRENRSPQVPQATGMEQANQYPDYSTTSTNWLPSMTYGNYLQGSIGPNVPVFEGSHVGEFMPASQDMFGHAGAPVTAVSPVGGFPHDDLGSVSAGAYPFNTFEDLLLSSNCPGDEYYNSTYLYGPNPSDVAGGFAGYG